MAARWAPGCQADTELLQEAGRLQGAPSIVTYEKASHVAGRLLSKFMLV